MTRGTSCNFPLLNQSIIRSLWEIWLNFVLKNQNQVRPVALERRLKGILQDLIILNYRDTSVSISSSLKSRKYVSIFFKLHKFFFEKSV